VSNSLRVEPSQITLPGGDGVGRALSRGHRIDITTTGRRTGLPRRIELVFHNIRGRIYISGRPSPRKRAWIHNLESDPRTVLVDIAAAWHRDDLDVMVAASPLIEVMFEAPQPA
jgi:hypothetical protein